MKPSPIQLIQAVFRHVRIEVDPTHMPSEPPNPLTSIFVFDGVTVHSEFGIDLVDPAHERGQMFQCGLRVKVDNQPDSNQRNQKFCPYQIDVAVDGLIVVSKGSEKLAPPEELAAVNGAAVLWATIREQVLAITGRMPVGPVMLPTVHFQDLRKAPVEEATPAVKTPRKRQIARSNTAD